MTSRSLCLCATLLFASQSVAQPDGPPAIDSRRVLIVPTDDADAERIEALYGGLRATGLEVVERDDRIGVDLPREPSRFEESRPDAVKDALLVAKARLREFDIDGTRAALDAGESAVFRLAQPELYGELYAELLLARASLDLAEGDPDRALAELTLLARLEPERESLHAGLYPPNLVDAFAEARAANASAEAGYLVVVPRPRDATITVDELRDVRAGQTLTLGEGAHLVTVRAEGRLTHSRRIDIVAGRSTLVEPYVAEPGVDAARAELVDKVGTDDDNDAAGRLCALSGADVLLVVGARSRVFTGAAGFVPVEVTASTAPLEVAAAVRRALTAPSLVVAPDDVAPPAAEEAEEGSLLPLLAGGAAAGALLLGVAVTSVGVAAWAFMPPAEPVAPPPRPVVISVGGSS